MKKGITFVPKEEPSEEALIKLNKLISDRDLRIEKTIDKYKKSRLEILSNFSDEFLNNQDVQSSSVVHCSLELLIRGENVYKIFEFLATQFVERDKSQMEIMRQLIENSNVPITFSAKKQ